MVRVGVLVVAMVLAAAWAAAAPVAEGACDFAAPYAAHGEIKWPADWDGRARYYGRNQTCTWAISTRMFDTPLQYGGGVLYGGRFQMLSIQLAHGDKLTVFDGVRPGGKILATFDAHSPVIDNKSAYLIVRDAYFVFESDGELEGPGFHIYWTAGPIGCFTNAMLGTNSTGIYRFPPFSYQPRYQDYNNCYMTFTAPSPNMRVGLKFLAFALEATFDFIYAYDGPNASMPLILKQSGFALPPTIVSSGPNLAITISADQLISYSGLVAEWTYFVPSDTVQCSSIGAGALSGGVISSPGEYDGLSTYDTTPCVWSITALAGTRVRFNFIEISLGVNATVTVYDGTSASAPQLANVTGRDNTRVALPPFYSTGVNAYVAFDPDDGHDERLAHGFSARWDSVFMMPCNAETDLGQVTSTTTLSFPGTAVNTGNTCVFLMRAPLGGRLVVTFAALDLLNGNTLEAFDGLDTDAPSIQQWSGPAQTPTFTSTQPYVAILLTLGEVAASNSLGVFSATVTPASATSFAPCVPLRKLPYAAAGNISAPAPFGVAGATYGRTDDCVWFIHASSAPAVRIRFDSIDITAAATIRIFDGPDIYSPLIGEIGRDTPLPIDFASSSQALTVHFLARGAAGDATGAGFSAHWWQIDPGYMVDSQITFYASNATQSFTYPSNGLDGVVRYDPGCRQWGFCGLPGRVIRISLEFFDIEETYDYMVYMNAAGGYNPVLRSWSGSKDTGAVVVGALNEGALLRFCADSLWQGHGMRVNYTCVTPPTQCSGTVTQTGSGSFSAPTPYDPTFDYAIGICSWQLTATAGNRVVLTFEALDILTERLWPLLQPHGPDFIYLYEGTVADPNALIANITQTTSDTIPFSRASQGASMLVVFEAQNTFYRGGSGFVASWSSQPGPSPCPAAAMTADAPTHLTLPDPYGTFFYKANSDCTVTVRTSTSARMMISVDSFDGDGVDALSLYDGDSTTSGALIGDMTVQPSLVFYSSGPVFTYRFTSDATRQNLGFQLTVTPINGSAQCLEQTNVTGASGYLSDPIPYDGVTLATARRCEWNIVVDAGYNQLILETGDVARYEQLPVQSTLRLTYDTFFGVQSVVLGRRQSYGISVEKTGLANLVYQQSVNPSLGFELNWRAVAVTGCTGVLTLTGATGSLASHTPADGVTRHLRNANCAWLINVAEPNTQIRFYFDYRPSSGMFVYDGNSTAAPMLYNSTSPVFRSALLSTGRSLYVTFAAPAGVLPDRGFSARYEAGTLPGQCAGVVTSTAGYGVVETPVPWDGANLYAYGLDCAWLLSPAAGYTNVRLDFPNLNVQVTDAVKVYDGSAVNAPLIGSYSQPSSLPIVSSGANLLVTFQQSSTAVTTTGTGFSLNWTSVYAAAICSQFNFPPDGSGVLSYPDPWGVGYRTSSGTDCSFLLHGEPHVQVQMQQLSLLGAASILTVYDGYHNLAPVLQTFTGTNAQYSCLDRPLVSSSEYMLVRLQTGLLDKPDYGFQLTYQATTETNSCPQQANVPIYACEYAGNVSSPTDYDFSTGLARANLAPCVYTIQAQTGTRRLRLTLEHAIMPGCNDVNGVNIYDGKNTSAAPILYFMGCDIYNVPIIETTQEYATIVFSGLTGYGFLIHWEAIEDTGEARNTYCPEIPVPTAPALTTSTTGNDTAAIQAAFPTYAIAIIVVIVVAVLVVVIGLLVWKKRRGSFDERDVGAQTRKMSLAGDLVMKRRVLSLLKQPTTKQIGKGGTATVFKVHMEDGTWAAFKHLTEVSELSKTEFHREATIMGRLSGKVHPNVIQLVLFCADPPVLVQELAERGSLHRMRKEFSDMANDKKKAILLQIAEGMRFLHENSIVHLDLKPENVLVDDSFHFKISDFGTSFILGHDVEVDNLGCSVVSTFTGTPHYSPPERFLYGKRIDFRRVDIYSFGVMTWVVLTGDLPFEGMKGPAIVDMHIAKKFDAGKHFPVHDKADPVMTDIIRRAMLPDASLRPLFFDLACTLRTDDLSAVPTLNYSMAASSADSSTKGVEMQELRTLTGSDGLTENPIFNVDLQPPPPPPPPPAVAPTHTEPPPQPTGAPPPAQPRARPVSVLTPDNKRASVQAANPFNKPGSRATMATELANFDVYNMAPPPSAPEGGDKLRKNPFLQKRATAPITNDFSSAGSTDATTPTAGTPNTSMTAAASPTASLEIGAASPETPTAAANAAVVANVSAGSGSDSESSSNSTSSH